MNAADRQGSPSDRGGGKSSTPLAAGSQPEVIEVDDGKAVLVITPALVYDMKGEAYALPANIVKAVNQFTAVSYTHLRAPRDLSTSRMPSSA